ncbi:DUF4317 domain-containing protein [Clostridium boliviensis]|uniref:DUF4317 domain-containing protein n=1 Tax=Clostridium boliviensis TaxID=318465 RepID=A0ABU4GS87_9CLOT|nr:DUF4317 domain-containing protein [Clostridium boliviensis]MDW2800499.1 DUF4317 domain-containing protein [Clostridium boliviensis]
MNKKEVSEVKKLLNPTNCCITRICSSYVDSEKNKRTELKEAFLSLPEEDAFKYFTIFKTAMTGSIGKNLFNMEFPTSAEAEGGTQNFLMRLRNSQLKDDSLIEEFYDKVIGNYEYAENYYIILIHCAYDIPSKSTDGMEMYDASEFVYEFIQCTICPVKLSKAGLCYNSQDNVIENRNRDWVVESPETGFIFPAFTDRNTNIHGLLYYAKNPEQIQERLIDELLGCVIPLSAKSQKETFQTIIEYTLGEKCDFETVKNIHDSINEMIEEANDESVPLTLDKDQIKQLLVNNGATPEKLEEYDQCYKEYQEGENSGFMASNVSNTKSFEIKTTDVSIKVAPDKSYLVKRQLVNGRSCIVIETSEHIEINGIVVK